MPFIACTSRSAMTRVKAMRAAMPPGTSRKRKERVFIIWTLRPGHRRREDIAAAAHRLDQARLLGVGLDLAAQPAHLHVDAAVERARHAAAREIEQLVARQHALRMLGEGDQEIE